MSKESGDEENNQNGIRAMRKEEDIGFDDGGRGNQDPEVRGMDSARPLMEQQYPDSRNSRNSV